MAPKVTKDHLQHEIETNKISSASTPLKQALIYKACSLDTTVVTPVTSVRLSQICDISQKMCHTHHAATGHLSQKLCHRCCHRRHLRRHGTSTSTRQSERNGCPGRGHRFCHHGTSLTSVSRQGGGPGWRRAWTSDLPPRDFPHQREPARGWPRVVPGAETLPN
jgi:hypothetical protein